jgi:flagellar biosynthesis/type III secretory pathway M-ring protein FliF/YscJ
MQILVPNETPEEAIGREVIVYDQNLKAPLAAGTVLGEVRVTVDGEAVGSVKLVNSSDIELSRSAYLKDRLADLFSKGWVIALLSLVLVFAVIYIALVTRYRKLRRRHLQERKRAEQRRRAEREQLYRSSRAYETLDPSERFAAVDEDFDEFFDSIEKD